LARSALGTRGPELIQTFPRQGYRFVGEIKRARKPSPTLSLQPRYARNGDLRHRRRSLRVSRRHLDPDRLKNPPERGGAVSLTRTELTLSKRGLTPFCMLTCGGVRSVDRQAVPWAVGRVR
jgi:hypothetical protein